MPQRRNTKAYNDLNESTNADELYQTSKNQIATNYI